MTTLEERREWMRQGCPVHERVHPRPPCPDDAGYLLEVWPDKHMLTAFCQWCSQMVGVVGETLPGKKALTAPRQAVWPLCVWMDEHAGNPEGTACIALTALPAGVALDTWADNLMLGNVVAKLNKLIVNGSAQFYLLDPSPSYFDGDDAKRLTMLPVKAI